MIALPLTPVEAGIVIAIVAVDVAVGVPLIVTIAVVAFAATAVLIFAERPAGRFVNQDATG